MPTVIIPLRLALSHETEGNTTLKQCNVIFKCFDMGNSLFPQASLGDLASVIDSTVASNVYGEVIDVTVSLSHIVIFTCVQVSGGTVPRLGCYLVSCLGSYCVPGTQQPGVKLLAPCSQVPSFQLPSQDLSGPWYAPLA